jgi:hypothetical protein
MIFILIAYDYSRSHFHNNHSQEYERIVFLKIRSAASDIACPDKGHTACGQDKTKTVFIYDIFTETIVAQKTFEKLEKGDNFIKLNYTGSPIYMLKSEGRLSS